MPATTRVLSSRRQSLRCLGPVLRMALDALKRRDITQIHRVLERLVWLMARLTFAICQPAEIDRMLKRLRFDRGGGIGGVGQNGVTDVAVVADHLACVTDVLSVMTPETSGEIEVADVIRMRPPISLHL